ncbi:MAG: ribosome biogenesis factor YjgA [Legionellaceae bacterium]|nr:ribosome biogenesis factor YjgA [Legionellaceae bacterium]
MNDDEPSKSELKRQSTALQNIGKELADLKPEMLERLELPEPLKSEVIKARSITSHGALKRQYQLIGKRMRATDYESIIKQYREMQAANNSQTANFHLIEKWREKLINEGRDALTDFIETFQPKDIQHLRQLIQKAVTEKKADKSTGASKSLFRYIRDFI